MMIYLRSETFYRFLKDKIKEPLKIVGLLVLILIIQINTSTSQTSTFDHKNALLFPVRSVDAGINPASLGLFKDNPVDMFTGRVNINIPIYELKVGDFSLPISVSYSTGGFKVNEIASWVGLGWNLNCGGMITREVRGIPDEIIDNGYTSTSGSVLYENLIDGEINNATDPAEFITLLDIATGLKDGEPDLFSFNVGGLSGKFIFDKNGDIHFIGEHKNTFQISIEREIIQSNKCYNSIKQLIITSDDGIKYIFGNDFREKLLNTYYYIYYDTENHYKTFSDNYYSTKYYGGKNTKAWENENVFYYTSWYLQKIEFPDNVNTIDFVYIPEINAHYVSTSETKYLGKRFDLLGNIINVEQQNPFCIKRTNQYQLIQSQRLSRITFNGTTIEFVPEDNLREDCNDPLAQVVLGKAKALKQIKIFENIEGTRKTWEFNHSYFAPAPGSTEFGEFPSFIKRLKLDGISSGDEKWAFEYNYSPNDPKLCLPSRNTSSVDFWGYYKQNTSRLSIPKIYVYPDDYENSTYNSIYSIYKREVGSYQGSEYVLEGVDRTPDLTNTKAYTINKIIFPTKGYKLFEYELNTFMLDNVERVGPGLRIKTITSHFGNNSPDVIESFSYNNGSNTSGMITDLPDFAYRNIDAIKNYITFFSDPGQIQDAITNRINYSFCSIGNVNGGYVGYTNVTMSDLNNGKSEYVYDFQPSYLNPNLEPFTRKTTRLEHAWDDINGRINNYYYQYNKSVDRYPYFSPPDCSWMRGYLKEVTIRNNHGDPVEKQTYSYFPVENANIDNIYYVQANLYNTETATRIVYFLGYNQTPNCQYNHIIFSSFWGCYPLEVSLNDVVWGVNYYKTGYKRLESVVTTKYDVTGGHQVSSSKQLFYGNTEYKYPSHVEIQNSKGEIIKQKTYFPPDYSTSISSISNLLVKHILNKPIDMREYVENRLIKGSQIDYNILGQAADFYNFESDNNDIPFSSSNPYTFTHRQSATFHPQQNVLNEILTDNDNTTVYLWGYNYRYPIAKIINSNYYEVIAALPITYDELQTKSEAELILIFKNLRTTLSQAFITSYTYNAYKPLFPKSTETDINGKTTHYNYDSFGRLVSTTDQDGKIIQYYEYHYKGQ